MKRRGRLAPTGTIGVYRAPGAPDSPESAAWTAVLATNSPLSYVSAAQAWDIPVADDGKIHITRFDRRRLAWPAGVRVHRVALDPRAVTKRYGWPVTTRTETLLDCLGWLQPNAAQTLADRAQQQRWLSPADIERRLDNQPGRWGIAGYVGCCRPLAMVPILGPNVYCTDSFGARTLRVGTLTIQSS
jgi:hypothetical protein